MKPGIVQMSHIPNGFMEKQIYRYFSQFGKVIKVKLVRSKKTNNSRSVGFVKFLDENVAKIAASSMNNYLMFDKILKCKFLSSEELKPGALNRRRRPRLNQKTRALRFAERHNKAKTSAADVEEVKRKFLGKLAKKNAKFKSLGIDYQLTPQEVLLKPRQLALKREKAMKKEEPVEVKLEDDDDDGDDALGEVVAMSSSLISGGSASMLIDDSDTEITFKTPPNVVKKYRKSTRRNAAAPVVGDTEIKIDVDADDDVDNFRLMTSSATTSVARQRRTGEKPSHLLDESIFLVSGYDVIDIKEEPKEEEEEEVDDVEVNKGHSKSFTEGKKRRRKSSRTTRGRRVSK